MARKYSPDYGAWKIVGVFLVLMGVLVGSAYLAWSSEQSFKKECVAVGGRALVDNDGDVECYRNGQEIAEHGESKPR